MNYTRFQIYTILLLYHDFIFCVHLAVVQAKNCGGGCKFCAPAKGFAKRSMTPWGGEFEAQASSYHADDGAVGDVGTWL